MVASRKIPRFASLDDLVEFFETHDMGDYMDSMPEIDVEVDLQRRTYIVTLDRDLATRLSDISRRMGVPETRLIRSWLEEKVTELIS